MLLPVFVHHMKISHLAGDYAGCIYDQFKLVSAITLEDHYRNMQDMEFTVEHGKLYMLQTRNGKTNSSGCS